MIFQMYLTKDMLKELDKNNFVIHFDELILSKHYFHWGLEYPYRLLLNIEKILNKYDIISYNIYHNYTCGSNVLDLKEISLGVCLNTKTEQPKLNNMQYIQSDITKECGEISRFPSDIKTSELIKIIGKHEL